MTRDVLVVMPELGRGGAERHAVLAATTVDRNLWRPHVLAFADGPLREELTGAGVPVRIADDVGGVRGLAGARRRVEAELDRIDPDLVTGYHVAVDLPLRAALRSRDVPYLTWKHTYGHIGYRGLRERLLEQAAGGVVTRYGAVCHTQVRYLTDVLGVPPDRIDVVPNAVRVAATAPPPPPGEPVLLMPAAMRADKGHAVALEAFATVLRHRPDARLVLAGDGPCRPAIEQQARRLGIADRVDLLGLRHDVDRLLSGASACVLASWAVECFPYALLEAMAAGRAVVSTTVGGVPEMVDDGVTGALVPPRDPVALAGAMLRALDGATARTWGEAGRARALQQFDLPRWSRRITELFTNTSDRLGSTSFERGTTR